MDAKAHEETLKDILAEYCLLSVQLEFVSSVYEWCRENGIEEAEKDKPLKIVVGHGQGCRLLVNNSIDPDSVNKRVRAMALRSSLQNSSQDRDSMLNSDKKRIAYLAINEYASTIPDLEDDLLLDNWTFGEIERLGFFRE